jgi:hypothetical protein
MGKKSVKFSAIAFSHPVYQMCFKVSIPKVKWIAHKKSLKDSPSMAEV